MIDWERVLELRDEVGAEDFIEVVDLFLEEVEGTLNGLETGEMDEPMEEVMHLLKGTAWNLGFASMGRLCAEGELSATKGQDVDVTGVLASYRESKTAFMSGLNERGVYLEAA